MQIDLTGKRRGLPAPAVGWVAIWGRGANFRHRSGRGRRFERLIASFSASLCRPAEACSSRLDDSRFAAFSRLFSALQYLIRNSEFI